MIEAVVQGKLGPGAGRARERSEDLLTSTAFGLLRYLRDHSCIIAFLRQTRRVYLDGEKNLIVDASSDWLALPGVTRCEIEFWPRRAKYGQPDLCLRFRDAKRLLHLVLVEVKFDSGKSGEAGEADGESVDDEPDVDQLVKYGQGIAGIEPELSEGQKTVVYLTSHVIPPVRELAATLCRRPRMRLGWLSWRALAREIARFSEDPAKDLLRLLKYHGFSDFQGIRSEESRKWPDCGHFWRDGDWFAPRQGAIPIPRERFWRAG